MTGRWLRKNRCFRRMASYPRANGGSAILEFAFIAPVFFLLLFAIIEIGVIFFAQSTLQHATNNLGRMIRTGQVQGQNLTQDAVRQLVCNDISALIPCDNNLYIDIEAFSGFGSITFTPPVDQKRKYDYRKTILRSETRATWFWYAFSIAWSVVTPLLTPFLVNVSGNNHLLYASSAFRNEPFTTGISGC